jgi:catechol 2,3-dioxygenase-like lactoylglutathione lyase family enzyme
MSPATENDAFMKIEHLALWTIRLEPMRDFYLDHFNCSVSAKYVNPASGFNSYFLTFSAGGTRLGHCGFRALHGLHSLRNFPRK